MPRQSTPRRRLRWSWLALAAVLALAVGGLAFLRVWPPLATVMSASMSPTIKTGDIVILKKLDRPARIGDIVAISVPEEIRSRYGYPPVIIHRIVRIDADGVVTTKGDAYKKPDPFTVPRSALTTRVLTSLPAAGRVLAFLGSPLGLLWLVGGGVLVLGMPLLERYRDGQRREHDTHSDLHAVLRSVTDELAQLRVEAAAAQEQLRATNAALSKHVADLPAQIERAVAAAISAFVPPPAPAPPARAFGSVAASQWKAPARTPDLIGVLAGSAVAASAWDAPPPAAGQVRTHRFQIREYAVDLVTSRSF